MGLWVRFGLWTGSCLHVRFRGPPYVPHSQTQAEAAADTWTSTSHGEYRKGETDGKYTKLKSDLQLGKASHAAKPGVAGWESIHFPQRRIADIGNNVPATTTVGLAHHPSGF